MIFDRAPSDLADTKPCWYCEHWAGPVDGDAAMALCHSRAEPYVKATAATGCAFFLRVTGVDDDSWMPPPKVFVPLRALPATRARTAESGTGTGRGAMLGFQR